MEFPKSYNELTQVFRSASAPDIDKLSGEYLVDMLSVWPSFKRFSHRKVIYRVNNQTQGHNTILNMAWGHFFIEEGICREVDSLRVAVINYNRADNSFPVRGVRDHIRCVEKDVLYIGRFNYQLPERLLFLGYFSLEKILDIPLLLKAPAVGC
ncbi:MAG: hypothetical protein HZC49_14655 [Nitrospirae bacterium]|nr:hypothetical protein [Nitrospirota bacterium]